MPSISSTLSTAPAHRGRARGPWSAELTDLVRAASGGMLFGVPLLYTMEVWWVGSLSDPAQTAVVFALLAIPLFALNMAAGFRSDRDTRVRDAVADTIEGLAIGVVVSTGVLVLLREIDLATPAAVLLGKVLYESVPFCLGIGVARHFLHGDRAGLGDEDRGDESSGDESGVASGHARRLPPTVADLGATAVGAVFVALSIAPTDEVPMIAAAMTPGWLLLLIAASLVASYAIVFVAGFVGQEERRSIRGVTQRPAAETIVCYVVALVVSALLLGLFQRGGQPFADYLTRVVVLGLPAAIGGAAGRLAV